MLGPKTVSSYFGKPLLLVYSPLKKLPRVIPSFNYSPDIAPTVLEILGYDVDTFFFGKSMVSSRNNYQNLVTMAYQIVDQKQYISDPEARNVGVCYDYNEMSIPVRKEAVVLTDCERNRLIALYNKRLFGDHGVLFSSNTRWRWKNRADRSGVNKLLGTAETVLLD